jgi:hypothetical protein
VIVDVGGARVVLDLPLRVTIGVGVDQRSVVVLVNVVVGLVPKLAQRAVGPDVRDVVVIVAVDDPVVNVRIVDLPLDVLRGGRLIQASPPGCAVSAWAGAPGGAHRHDPRADDPEETNAPANTLQRSLGLGAPPRDGMRAVPQRLTR